VPASSCSPADLLAGIRPGVTQAWLIVYPTGAGTATAVMTDATAALNMAGKLHGVRLPLEVPASALPEILGESG
jgi:hypothetical protein